jgi:CRISPR-associated protein Cmr3
VTLLRVDARDPLVLRDGRPNDRRSESRTLPFPYPSTFAGVVRTALGRRGGAFDPTLIPALLQRVSVRGPLLLAGDDLLVPAPHDAVIVADADESLETYPLVPLQPFDVARCSGVGVDRRPVGFAPGASTRSKPLSPRVGFWHWSSFLHWLEDPRRLDDRATRELLTGAVVSLDREERVHVALGSGSTALDGMLFVTEGLRSNGSLFDPRDRHEREADVARGVYPRMDRELSFVIDVTIEGEALGGVTPGLRPAGGERRLTHWASTALALPSPPDWLVAHVAAGAETMVRVVLLTPAYLGSSLGPQALDRPGVAKVVAAKVDRPRTVSGWDFSHDPPRGRPKKSRRLADAGSVYWVALTGTAAERRRWLDDTWMRNLSDDPQFARDGFGLAVVGAGRTP